MEFGLSTYKANQCVTIQEMPERAPLGQLPRSVDVLLNHDLVDACKPGDRVQIIGVYRALAGQSGSTSGMFRTVVMANAVRLLSKDIQGVQLTQQDIQNIRKIAKGSTKGDAENRETAFGEYALSTCCAPSATTLLPGPRSPRVIIVVASTVSRAAVAVARAVYLRPRVPEEGHPADAPRRS